MQIDRIDSLPTDQIGGYRVRPGKPLPFGVSHVPEGLNFSIFTSAGTACTLVLFRRGEDEPFAELPFPENYRIGDVFCMVVFGLDYEDLEYGFRIDGPFDPQAGHRCDPSQVLMDPYARLIAGRDVWGEEPNWQRPYPYRARVSFDDFDWEGERPLEIPRKILSYTKLMSDPLPSLPLRMSSIRALMPLSLRKSPISRI
jgi:isoamylase